MTDFNQYQSPFSWRYGSPEMRGIWSENHKRKVWRQIWLILARCQLPFGLVTQAQVDELKAHVDLVDMERALQIETEIHHDLMAELKVFAEQCPSAGGIIHLGATSMDIEDNADALRIRQALKRILDSLDQLLLAFADKIEQTANLPAMAFTHIQPAEPTTLGYRFASYAQDLLEDRQVLANALQGVRGKGFKGAVGTAASYFDLIGSENYSSFEKVLSQELDLPFFEISTQTYPRKQDYLVISALAGLGASLYKFAFDLRLLQTPPIGELSEPFAKKQVGSSAMPFKRNPINAEKIDSLARALSVMPQTAWHNAGHTLLERTLDDSANRRTLLPESFLISDELLRTAIKITKDLNINVSAIQRNLDVYGPFAATERVMMAAVRHGADRQQFHEILRGHAMTAWEEVQAGRSNPLIELLKNDPEITKIFGNESIDDLLKINSYTGIASQRAIAISHLIRSKLSI